VSTLERVGVDASAIDLDRPVRAVFEAMRDDQIERVPGIDVATKDQKLMLHALARGYARGLGRWQDISGLDKKVGDGGAVIATGTAKFERGTPNFTLTFRIAGGAPQLANIDLQIPATQLPPVADAEAAARRLTADVAAGALDRVHDDLDPRVSGLGSIDDAIGKIHALTSPDPAIELVSHEACAGGQCFELRFPLTDGASQRVRITETPTFGLWLATNITLGDG
jgi:hypothetical protein